jgi:hypothetical protein
MSERSFSRIPVPSLPGFFSRRQGKVAPAAPESSGETTGSAKGLTDELSHEMRRLTGALEVVRDRLEPALPAEHELKAASVELEKVWAELSPAVTSRERFWDTV